MSAVYAGAYLALKMYFGDSPPTNLGPDAP
jgi:hypothetical protein